MAVVNSFDTKYKKCFRKMKKKNATLSAYKLSYLRYFVGRCGLARSYDMNLIFKIKSLIFESNLDRLYAGCYIDESSNCLIELVFDPWSSNYPLVELVFGVTLAEFVNVSKIKFSGQMRFSQYNSQQMLDSHPLFFLNLVLPLGYCSKFLAWQEQEICQFCYFSL